jgi:FAD/FMN-containing dehydrogenase
MSIVVTDLIGLNATPMIKTRHLLGQSAAKKYINDASTIEPLVIAGAKHSQGGHTMVRDGVQLKTENTLSRILEIDRDAQTIRVEAGVTWSAIHHALAPWGLCTWVQQSSAQFTVGGSISVNCHGRDANWGALSNTIISVLVLTGSGLKLTASRTENADLFSAILGGYGAFGLILEVTIKIGPNIKLQRHHWKPGFGALSLFRCFALQSYVAHIQKVVAAQQKGPSLLEMHHAFVNVSQIGWPFLHSNTYLNELVCADVKKIPNQTGSRILGGKDLKDEEWGLAEVMRMAWLAAQKDNIVRFKLWFGLIAKQKDTLEDRLNFMREGILFSMGEKITYQIGQGYEATAADLLFEYFIPVNQLVSFFEQLREVFPFNDGQNLNTRDEIRLNSSTLRLVSPDTLSLMSYCPNEDEYRISVAIDAVVPLEKVTKNETSSDWRPTKKATDQLKKAIDLALKCGGCYYLPYSRIATQEQFQRAYPRHEIWHQLIKKYNPDKKYWNEFLRHYLEGNPPTN